MTYMLINATQPPTGARAERRRDGIRILDQQPRLMRRHALLILIPRLPMHPPTISPYRRQLILIQHLTKLPQLVILLGVWLVWFRRTLASCLHLEEFLEGLQLGAFFDEAGYVDLRADVVAHDAPAVAEGGHHQQVHERRAVAAVVEEHFLVLLAGSDRVAEAAYAARVRVGAL
jgi:hypothetical protein